MGMSKPSQSFPSGPDANGALAKPGMTLIVMLVYATFLISYGLNYLSIPYVDLPTFYHAANAVFDEGRSPYDPVTLAETGERSEQTLFPFLYPPPSLLALYPYSLVSYRTAGLITLIANHLLILLFVFLFAKIRTEFNEPTFRTVALVYVFLFHPIVTTLNRGQVNLLVLVLICLAWLSLKRQLHAAWVALPLALAILIKAYPALILLYLLVRRKYRESFWCVGFLVLFSLVAFSAMPAQLWNDWFFEVLPTGGYGKEPLGLFSPAGPWNQSINGFTARLFLPSEFSEVLLTSPGATRIVPAAIAAFLLAALLAIGHRSARTDGAGEGIDAEFSLVLLTMFLVAPFSWIHHLVFVLPAALIALRRTLGRDSTGLPRLAVLAALIVLALRLPVWAEALKTGVLTLGISIKLYAVVLVWVFFAAELWKRSGSRAIVARSTPTSGVRSV
jgi:alpha-1,2-mannosyltransferase